MKNGKKEGYGVLTWLDGSKYEGEFKNDMAEGNGFASWVDGAIYDGHWHQGKQEGQGRFVSVESKSFSVYQLKWKNEEKHPK